MVALPGCVAGAGDDEWRARLGGLWPSCSESDDMAAVCVEAAGRAAGTVLATSVNGRRQRPRVFGQCEASSSGRLYATDAHNRPSTQAARAWRWLWQDPAMDHRTVAVGSPSSFFLTNHHHAPRCSPPSSPPPLPAQTLCRSNGAGSSGGLRSSPDVPVAHHTQDALHKLGHPGRNSNTNVQGAGWCWAAIGGC